MWESIMMLPDQDIRTCHVPGRQHCLTATPSHSCPAAHTTCCTCHGMRGTCARPSCLAHTALYSRQPNNCGPSCTCCSCGTVPAKIDAESRRPSTKLLPWYYMQKAQETSLRAPTTYMLLARIQNILIYANQYFKPARQSLPVHECAVTINAIATHAFLPP